MIAAFRQNQQQGFTPENVFPFDGVSPQHDLGYISNYCLKNWPSSAFVVGVDIRGTETPFFGIPVDGSGPVVTAAAGPLHVLGGTGGGQVYLDSSGHGGIGEVASTGAVVIGAGGNACLAFAPAAGGTPASATFSSATGFVYVLGEGIYFDANKHCGIGENSGNLVLEAGGYDALTFTADPKAIFSVAAGPVYVLNGNIYLDSGGSVSMGESGGNLVLGAAAGLVKTLGAIEVDGGNVFLDTGHYYGMGLDAATPANLVLHGGSGYVTTPNNMEVTGGTVYLDSGHNFGMALSSGNLVLSAGTAGGIVKTGQDLQAGGYRASDGTPGTSVLSGPFIFKNGLYISGTFVGTDLLTGVVEDVTNVIGGPNDFYVRNNVSGSGTTTGGRWVDMLSFFPGLDGTQWKGSTYLTTLGTISTGIWNGTAIADAYISSAAHWNDACQTLNITGADVKGNGTSHSGTMTISNLTLQDGSVTFNVMQTIGADTILGSIGGGHPAALRASSVKTIIGLDLVENTALSTWTGSGALTTGGAFTATSLHSTGGLTVDVNATVSGALSVGSTLVVTGGSSLAAATCTTLNTTLAVGIGGNLTVTGTTNSLAGTTSLVTLHVSGTNTTIGTVTSGTWHGGTIAAAYLDLAGIFASSSFTTAMASYATQSWVTNQGYATTAALGNYVLTTDLTTALAAKQNSLPTASSPSTQFLRGDLTWQVPSGGGGGAITCTTLAASGAATFGAGVTVTSGNLNVSSGAVGISSYLLVGSYLTVGGYAKVSGNLTVLGIQYLNYAAAFRPCDGSGSPADGNIQFQNTAGTPIMWISMATGDLTCYARNFHAQGGGNVLAENMVKTPTLGDVNGTACMGLSGGVCSPVHLVLPTS